MFLVGYMIVRQGKRGNEKPRRESTPTANQQPELMLPCARCGVHVPASEAVLGKQGMHYCCAEHAAQHQDGPTS